MLRGTLKLIRGQISSNVNCRQPLELGPTKEGNLGCPFIANHVSTMSSTTSLKISRPPLQKRHDSSQSPRHLHIFQITARVYRSWAVDLDEHVDLAVDLSQILFVDTVILVIRVQDYNLYNFSPQILGEIRVLTFGEFTRTSSRLDRAKVFSCSP